MTSTLHHAPTSRSLPTSDNDLRIETSKHLRRRSFAILSTVSDRGVPHAAAVAYSSIDFTLYVNTSRTSRKARNIVDNGRAAVVVPVRRVPVGPPFSIQFQGRATLLAMDDPAILRLINDGRLGSITSHGELDEADGCFLRIEPTDRVHTYGLGVSVMAVAKDPLHAGARSFSLAVRGC